MTSFFGGDPNVSHFTLSIPFNYTLSGDARRAAEETRREQSKKLKEAGYKERYFQFRNRDKKGKERARALAEAERKLWLEATGIDLRVTEGFFL